ncbi:MAG: hypothetical protein RLZ25_327 [Pseudomonadota bacterium]
MRAETNLMVFLRMWIAAVYRKTAIRFLVGLILVYGIATALLVPLACRQMLPTLITQTGIGLTIQSIHWHPYKLRLRLDQVSVGTKPESEILKAQRLDLDIGLMRSLYHRALAFDAIMLVNPFLDIHSTTQGKTNLDVLLENIKSKTADAPESRPEETLRLAVSSLGVMGGQLKYAPYQDRTPLSIQDLGLSVRDVVSWQENKAEFLLNIQMDDQAHLRAEGTFIPDGSDSRILFESRAISLAQLEAQIPPLWDLPDVQGELDLSGHLTIRSDSTSHIHLEHLRTELRDLKVSRPQFDLPVITLGKFAVDEGNLDLAGHHIELEALEIEDLGLNRLKTAEGKPGWQTLAPKSSQGEEPQGAELNSNTPEVPWRVDIHHIQLDNLKLLPQPQNETINAPDFRIGNSVGEGLSFDTAKKQFAAEKISLKDSRLLFGFDKAGILPLTDITAQTAPSEPQDGKEEVQSPWAFRIDQTEITDLSLGVMRFEAIDPMALALNAIHLDLGAIDTEGNTDTPLSLSADSSSGGKLAVKGLLNVRDLSLNVSVKLDQLGLNPLKSLLSESLRFDTVEGQLSSQLKFKGRFASGEPEAEYEGQMQVEGLRLTQSPGDRKLLAWRSLAIDGVTGKLHPLRLSVNEIRITDPDGVIAIREDKSSNVSDLRGPEKDGLTNKPVSNAKIEDPDIQVRRIRIEGGKLDYSDQSLVLPFTTQIVDLKGAITGWTLEPTGKSLLELNGRIAPYGEAAIHGQLRPRDPKSSMDIDLHFENVVLSALTPYSATFAGRRIQEGKLDLNAHYQLEDQQLKSDNRIYLKQLRLGDKVESPKALSLPLDLAVALLSDVDGNIDLSLPIEGRTDAPDFDYGTVVLNAFGNLIKRAVLSPFTALSSALGLQGGDELNAIAFDMGSDVLTPPEKEKIGRLAEALQFKPQLQLTLNGVFETQADLLVLRHSWLRKEVASRLGEAIKQGEDPDPVNPTESSTQRILETMAKESDLLGPTLTRYMADTGHSPDRVGLVGPLFGKGSKTPDFYEFLIEALIDHAPLDQSDLKQLAERRMKTVKESLMAARKSLDPKRIRMGEIQEQASEDGHHLKMPLSLQLE